MRYLRPVLRPASHLVAAAVVALVLAGCGLLRAGVAIDDVSASDDPQLSVRAGTCGDPTLTAQVEESDRSVTITITRTLGQRGDGDCGGIVPVLLSDPLGERAVVDGTTGAEVEVRNRP